MSIFLYLYNISDFDYFFKNNDIKIYQDEINSLMRRLDYDNDGLISLNDYEYILK